MKDAALTLSVCMENGTSGETHVVSLRGPFEAKADTRGVDSRKATLLGQRWIVREFSQSEGHGFNDRPEICNNGAVRGHYDFLLQPAIRLILENPCCMNLPALRRTMHERQLRHAWDECSPIGCTGASPYQGSLYDFVPLPARYP